MKRPIIALLLAVIAFPVLADVNIVTATRDEIVIDYRYGVFELVRPGKVLDKSTDAARIHCDKYDRDVVYEGKLSYEKNRNIGPGQ